MIHTPKIVCISPFFVPLANAEAFSGGKMVMCLRDAGIDVTVICVDYSGNGKFRYEQSPLWHSLARNTISIPPSGNRQKILSIPLGAKFQTTTWSRWVAAVVQQVRFLHGEQPFDAIYSRGLPSVAHVAGYWLARCLGLPWIANFNDPWDLEATHLLPQSRHLRKKGISTLLSDWWLRSVMRNADLLTFPCARLRDYHLQLVNFRPRCAVVPHIGLSAENHNPLEGFRLVHAGNLGFGESTRREATGSLLRGLRSFLNSFPEAKTTTILLLVGPEDTPTMKMAAELGLDSVVFCTGRVSYEESLEYVASAATCLLVEGKMPEGIYLPSKLADYLVSRKPVIALSPADGTIADIAHLKGITRVAVDNEDEISKAIAWHYELFSQGKNEDLHPGDDLIAVFSGDRIGREFRYLLEQVIEG